MGFLVDSSVKPLSSLAPIVFLSKRSAKAQFSVLSGAASLSQQERDRLQALGQESEGRMGTDRPGGAAVRP